MPQNLIEEIVLRFALNITHEQIIQIATGPEDLVAKSSRPKSSYGEKTILILLLN